MAFFQSFSSEHKAESSMEGGTELPAGSGSPLERPATLKAAVLIAGLLTVVAAILRFNALDAGLRHEPHSDERVFVEESLAMISRGDWVPRFFEYPGLLLWAFKGLFMLADPVGAEAYVLARSLVAACASAAVFLVTFLACRWFSPLAGGLSGLLLALSPVCAHTAQTVRPDAVIHGVILAALAAGAPLRGRSRPMLAWVLGAVASAIKFSAALVFPALLLAALLDRVPFRRIVVLGVVALVTFVFLSPWTLLSPESFSGLAAQLGYHYSHQAEILFPTLVHHLTHTLPLAISWPGIGLALLGLVTLARTPRGFIWVAFIVLWILVFSSTDVPFIRFMVPVLGALILGAGAGFMEVFVRIRPLPRLAMAAWALAALAISGFEVVRDAEERARPSTRDRALDWIEAHPTLLHVGSMEPGLGRFSQNATDIVDIDGAGSRDELLLGQLDALIVTPDTPAPPDFTEAARFKPDGRAEGRELVALVHETPPRFVPERLEPSFLRTSAPDRESKLLSNLTTRWRADTSPAFIEITLPEPAHLARVELRYGPVSRGKDQVSRVFVDGRRVPFSRVRGPVNRQRRDRTVSELLAFEPTRARTVRLELPGEPPFIASELRLYSLAAN